MSVMPDLPWQQQKKIKEHMHSLMALFEMMWKFNQGSHDFKRAAASTHVSLYKTCPRSDTILVQFVAYTTTFGADAQKKPKLVIKNMQANLEI